LLEVHGLDVEAFESAEAFQHRIEKRDASCVILDINLRSISGIDLCRQLTSSDNAMPVIFITGNDSEAVHEAAVAAGCIAILVKPFPGASLIKAIEEARTTNI
jgi:FixJ family two-component response regulator